MDPMDGPQQPLEISPGMAIAIAILLGIGWISSDAQRDGRHEDEMINLFRRPTIVRSTGQPISFPQLGIVVTPTDGWSHLSVESGHHGTRATFSNEKLKAIAKLSDFPYKSWPPGGDAILTQSDQTSEADTRLRQAVVAKRSYKRVDVEWLEIEGQLKRQPGFHYGRIKDDPIDLLLTVLQHASGSASEDAIARLCNAIKPID